MKNSRLRRRGLAIATSALNSLALPLLSPLFSLLVIRLASVELWGEFVRVLVVVQLGAHIVVWGNKDYLLREFSLAPAHLARAWQTSLITRLSLFFVYLAVISFLGYPPLRWIWLVLLSLSLVLVQAYEVFVIYRRDFAFSIAVELIHVSVAALALPALALRGSLTLDGLIIVFSLSNVVKIGLFFLRYRAASAAPLQGRFDLAHLRLAFPFFLLGFSGLLQSKIDLYCVNAFLSRREIGHYQVFINLMIYVQSVSGFILVPFVKSLYRLSYPAIRRISVRLFGAGLVITGAALPAAHLALVYLYRFDLPATFLLWGALFILPIYFYLPIIYALFKAGQPGMVIAFNFAGMAAGLLLNVWLLPRLGMLGGVVASAAVQWLLLLAYAVRSRVLRRELQEAEAHGVAVPELS
ncbi:MAG: lipopolysaccharide biosynthesis protein [Anaerolineales bacterium]